LTTTLGLQNPSIAYYKEIPLESELNNVKVYFNYSRKLSQLLDPTLPIILECDASDFTITTGVSGLDTPELQRTLFGHVWQGL